ncbi:LysR family transcriptional regulator [Shewanella sedimentimangrovi]|uniref:LysR family transcriptional regulator n=1 Tax=Shewanella sedimentimangrovi TaxID=2814293 RepID=A0ABX7R1M7_9GAMM|nr:LysR family transcriptional regulator [Shewanella sedimentimangrovi]QSX36741.1 LysR family transcriptional regulator [Shewanella sedimentimangrovi]
MKTEDLALFHRIVESGSLVTAADLLNLPKSTVSRRLQSLEEELNVKLFHRQSRAISLTAAGSLFYQRSLGILSQLDETLIEMTRDDAELSGHLRIQMFPLPETVVLNRLIFRFMALHPKLTVEVIDSTEVVDMVKHNLDVAFLIEQSIEGQDVVAKPVLTTELGFFASPDYLARQREPRTLEDMAAHNVALYRLINGKVFNEVEVGTGPETLKVRVQGNFCTNNLIMAREFALQGKGITYLPTEMCDAYLASGQLRQLLTGYQSHKGECFLVYPSRRFVSLACRRFIDFILQELTPDGKPLSMRVATGAEPI